MSEPSAEQPLLFKELGGPADRLAADRTTQFLDEPEASLAFDLRHTLLAQKPQGTALSCCPGFVDPALEIRETTPSTPCQGRTGQPAFGGPVLGAARQGIDEQ
jgi:hypothetical protein